MPAYDFVCPKCGHIHEIYTKMEWRDRFHFDCPSCGTALRRKISSPMAEIWAGKFQGRSLKKEDLDGLGPEW
jgi:putative FmdB family regulatory protein